MLTNSLRQATSVSDEQLRAASRNHRRHLQAALAGGSVLQMDQAAPAHQGLLRHQREYRENPNLDRCLRFTCWWPSCENASASKLQVLSLTLFEKTPILRALQQIESEDNLPCPANQLNLFNL
jgi:hypothetical protein